MTKRLAIEWPDAAPCRDRDGAPIRLLAVSDVMEPTLLDIRNRDAMSPVDLIVGCGDLDCDDLSYIVDCFNSPIVYVYGNHDTDDRWKQCGEFCPEALQSTATQRRAGLSISGLTWPGRRGKASRVMHALSRARISSAGTNQSACREAAGPMGISSINRT